MEEVGKLDTDVTLLYKKARKYNIPTKFVNVKIKKNGNGDEINSIIDRLKTYEYINIFNPIQELIIKGTDLNEIQKIYDLSLNDMQNIYYIIATNEGIDNETMIKNVETLNQLNIGESIELNMDDIIGSYELWVNDINKIKKTEKKKLEQFLVNFDIIDNADLITPIGSSKISVQVTPIKFTSYIHHVRPSEKVSNGTTRDVNTYDGVDIFNFSRCSQNIPYIQYNNERKYYKLYNKEELDYDAIIPKSSQTDNDDHLYMTIWTDDESVKKQRKESFILVKYNIAESKMIFKTSERDNINTYQLVVDRIEESTPLKINYVGDIRVSGEFYIYGMEYEEITFVFNLKLQSIFNTYLYIDESTKPYPFKKRVFFHLRSVINTDVEEDEHKNKSIAWISINYDKTDNNTIVVETENNQSAQIPPNTPYVKINIIRAINRDIVNQLHYLLPRLLTIYNDKNVLDSSKNIIYRIAPGIEKYVEISDDDRKKITKGMKASKISQMKEIAPELIVKEYARKCQCSRQPIIIPQEDVPMWSSKTFIMSGMNYLRQILPFPPDDPKWFFVCPNNEWPYPGVKKNTLENKHIFPFIPCCFKKNEMNPKANSYYNEYFKGIPKRKTTKINKSMHVIKTDKLLEPQRTGKISKSINKLLNITDNNEYVRVGVFRSPNSMIHSILDAFQFPQYNMIQSYEEKERYVSLFRLDLVQKLQEKISLVKQEMYDFDDDEIISTLSNTSVFLDPSIYYRIFEEIFNINIYVFTVPKDSEQLSYGKLEIPRHKYFHARPLKENRLTIILFKYYGSDSDKILYPQCEYIAEFLPEIGIIKRFYGNVIDNINEDTKMVKLLHDTMLNTHESITWSIDPHNFRPVARSNIFSSFNIFEIFGIYKQNIIGQYIDEYGKCRGFAFKYNESTTVEIYTPPTQPEFFVKLTKNIQPENKPSYDIVLSILSINPLMITIDLDDQNEKVLTGFWYPLLDIETGVYIPVYPFRLEDLPENYKYIRDIPIGPKFYFFANAIDDVKRVRKLKKTRDIVLQLIKWLFDIYRSSNKNYDINILVNDFLNNFITVSSKNYEGIDSSMVYDFSLFPRILPDVSNVYEGISYLESFVPSLGFIENKRIIGYNEKFTDGCIYFLKEYATKSDGLVITPSKYIDNKYSDVYDFTQFKDNIVFVNENELKTWLYSVQHLGVKTSHIKKNLSIEDTNLKEPYLYLDKKSGKIVMIQNVENGDLARAINVAYTWYIDKKNKGYDTEQYVSDTIPSYIIYAINPTGYFTVQSDKSEGQENYLQIALYNNQSVNINPKYAAILPMI